MSTGAVVDPRKLAARDRVRVHQFLGELETSIIRMHELLGDQVAHTDLQSFYRDLFPEEQAAVQKVLMHQRIALLHLEHAKARIQSLEAM